MPEQPGRVPTDDLRVGSPPTASRLLRRGLRKRCPACGERDIWASWGRPIERCPNCGLVFERIEGHFVGAVGINTIVSFIVLFMVLIVSMILTAPEFELWILLPVNVGVTLAMTTWFMPISKTLWTSFDIMMRPLRPDEVDWSKAGD